MREDLLYSYFTSKKTLTERLEPCIKVAQLVHEEVGTWTQKFDSRVWLPQPLGCVAYQTTNYGKSVMYLSITEIILIQH